MMALSFASAEGVTEGVRSFHITFLVLVLSDGKAARIRIPRAINHVTSRGEQQELIYEDDADHLQWLEVLSKVWNGTCQKTCANSLVVTLNISIGNATAWAMFIRESTRPSWLRKTAISWSWLVTRFLIQSEPE